MYSESKKKTILLEDTVTYFVIIYPPPPHPNALGFVVWSNKAYITMFNIAEYFRHISVWQIIFI